jgi:hypothetical protein
MSDMYIESDLSEIACPKCNKNNDNLEVIRMYVFTQSNYGKEPYYDIKCYNCNELFTSQVCVSIDEI